MPKLRSFAEAAGKWLGIMSGPISVPFGVLALLDAWSQQKTFAVLAYFSLWGTVIHLANRLRKAEQRPKLLPFEIIQIKCFQGEQLMRTIEDVSKPIPKGEPRKWIEEARDCLREHAPEFVRSFNVACIPTDFTTPIPPEITKAGRHQEWESLRDHLRVFAHAERAKVTAILC